MILNWLCWHTLFNILYHFHAVTIVKKISDLHSGIPCQMDLYVAGFPCTPYSTLGTMLRLSDPNARQLYACIRRLKKNRPCVPRLNFKMEHAKCHYMFNPGIRPVVHRTLANKVGVLENVMGFKACSEKVAIVIAQNCPKYLGNVSARTCWVWHACYTLCFVVLENNAQGTKCSMSL